MVMTQENFDRLMPKEKQEKEVQRLKDAEKGTVLFELATGVRAEWKDSVETLLDMAKVKYEVSVANYMSYYTKK